MRRRVLYIIDHQRQGRDRWLKPETSTTSVEASGDQAALELADKFELTTVWVVTREGCRIRVRVWPEPEGFDAMMGFDPDSVPVEGTWVHDPQAAR